MNKEKKEICNKLNSNTETRNKLYKKIKINNKIKLGAIILSILLATTNIILITNSFINPEAFIKSSFLILDSIMTTGLCLTAVNSVIKNKRFKNKIEYLKKEFELDALKLEKLYEEDLEKTNINTKNNIVKNKTFNNNLEQIEAPEKTNSKVKVFKK